MIVRSALRVVSYSDVGFENPLSVFKRRQEVVVGRSLLLTPAVL